MCYYPEWTWLGMGFHTLGRIILAIVGRAPWYVLNLFHMRNLSITCFLQEGSGMNTLQGGNVVLMPFLPLSGRMLLKALHVFGFKGS